MTATEIAVACIGGLTLGGMAIWIGTALHLARTSAEDLKQYFANSPFVRMNIPSKNDSVRTQLWCVGSIASCIALPSAHIKLGRLSADDLNNLPSQMKLKLQIIHWSSLGLIATLLITYLIGKYGLGIHPKTTTD